MLFCILSGPSVLDCKFLLVPLYPFNVNTLGICVDFCGEVLNSGARLGGIPPIGRAGRVMWRAKILVGGIPPHWAVSGSLPGFGRVGQYQARIRN